MRKVPSDRVYKIAFVVFLAAFCAGIVQLMTLRFKIGDVYPAYSSLRTDPLGTKAYMESLDSLAGVSAQRNLKDLAELEGAEDSAILFLGIRDSTLYYMSEDQVASVESLAGSGNRVVLTLYPKQSFAISYSGDKEELRDDEPTEGEEEIAEPEDSHSEEDDTKWPGVEDKDFFARSPVATGLRFSLGVRGEEDDIGVLAQAKGASALDDSELPLLLSWHSDIYFKDLGENWDIVYELDGLPVMIERRYGEGSIVLASDSFLVSNEAMLNDRQPELLAWLVDDSALIVFDETHLGIGERPGVVSLMRKYNLHGLLAGILILAVLFVWKSSSSLVPATEDPASMGDGTGSGKDYGSGVVSLLRRNVSSSNVLSKCFEEWKNAFPKKYGRMPQKIKSVRKIIESERKLPHRQRNPVKAYREITKILSERKSI